MIDMMIIQYIMLGSNNQVKFHQNHKQEYRPMKGDVYFANMETGECIELTVDRIVTHPENIDKKPLIRLDIIAYIK